MFSSPSPVEDKATPKLAALRRRLWSEVVIDTLVQAGVPAEQITADPEHGWRVENIVIDCLDSIWYAVDDDGALDLPAGDLESVAEAVTREVGR